MAYEFTDSTFKYVFEAEFSLDTYNSAYTLLQESTCSYSYNATTKRLYYRKTGYNSYVVRGDKKTALFDSSYSTDEIIARYNRAQKLSDKKILREAYSVVSYGSFTIKYATSNNIPDFTSEPEYPLVVE